MATNGSNRDLGALKKTISSKVDAINAALKKRQAANETIAAAKSALAEEGIPKKALNMALSYLNMDPDDREGFDVAYDIVREAIGLSIEEADQSDFFKIREDKALNAATDAAD